ncbi:copine-4-like [Corticium candelabrum]|uniref:copine-4-like n=1 Tax=Corticium candelabrum TaxID=121492 RepID=UPI002E264E1A|nr:copine-4-like [Corticium candelabrum]
MMATGKLSSQVVLYISCQGLLNADLTSKSDPLVSLLHDDRRDVTRQWSEVGRTERVENSLDPSFATPIKMSYCFEEVQKLQFRVYDIDVGATYSLSDDDFLGSVETTLGSLVGNHTTQLPLKRKGKDAGTIKIIVEEGSGSSEVATFSFRARHLDNKDFLGKSDPFLVFERTLPDGQSLTIHRTEVVKNNLNPSWRSFNMSVQELTGQNEDQHLTISCYDYDDDGGHDLIGVFTTSWKEMKEAMHKEMQWECISPKKKATKKKYVNSGVIYLSHLKVEKLHTFVDFVSSGCQINFTVGIDFTASNGDPKTATSLHFLNPYEPNEYMKALVAVGSVCEQYDTDKLFPAFGFGAKIPPEGKVSHEFPLNFNPSNPYCAGIIGVTGAYQAAIQQVSLYGPTNAAPIINHVARFARQAEAESKANNYFILLLLTDGVLSDMVKTKSAIIEASHLPMSIIIVGVGNANFADMRELDSDDSRLKVSGKNAVRDIVQFVPFANYRNSSPADLARDVLAEVPAQVVEYFRMKGLHPMERVVVATTAAE